MALMVQALEYAERYEPVTLRQLFYLLVNNGWLYKIEREYKNLGTLLTKMRRGETEVGMDWDLIIDAGRQTRAAATWSSAKTFVDIMTRRYRRSSRLSPISIATYSICAVPMVSPAGPEKRSTKRCDWLRGCRGTSCLDACRKSAARGSACSTARSAS